jgi:hypothetical protein
VNSRFAAAVVAVAGRSISPEIAMGPLVPVSNELNL